MLFDFESYTDGLRKGYNKFRWIEYSLSSSVMIVLIAMLFGVYDIMTLIGIIGVNASMNLFGLNFEMMNSYKRDAGDNTVDWSAFWFGCFAGIIPWIQVYAPLFTSDDFSQIPWFVWGILLSYALFFNTFPINMYLQYAQIGSWSDAAYPDMNNGGYYYGEKVYQILSLASKSILVWFTFSGTMQPQTDAAKMPAL